METPELAQNKTMSKEGADRTANENIGEDEKKERKREGVPESSSEDKAKETQTIEANLETLSHDILEIVHKVAEEFKWCDIPSDKATFKCLTRLVDSRKNQRTNDFNRQLSETTNWWTVKMNYNKRFKRVRQG